eukprot:CAMPEP_0172753460 /NCGR_PEP_ID=MMETSP1074-20121228/156006_1 /TAXON_ID=2916 /ORGANISM="Ceratium fusus, Strain PA161109" /LENGTH=111 /DNA_ID=CAMNT_0013586143 /DNA_START=356 /DNA_END=688 /DNA_ORIENTATION=+
MWVLCMDRPYKPHEARDGDLSSLFMVQLLAVEARPLRQVCLVVIEPGGDHCDIAFTSIACNVCSPDEEFPTNATRTHRALHLMPAHIAGTILAAIVEAVVRKVPTVPPDHA